MAKIVKEQMLTADFSVQNGAMSLWRDLNPDRKMGQTWFSLPQATRDTYIDAYKKAIEAAFPPLE